jgi:hypothetical protein
MAGLFGTSIDDPKTLGILQLASGLMSSPRFGQGMSQGLLAYGDTMQRAKQQQAQEKMNALREEQARMQMEQMRAQMQQQQTDRQAMQSMFTPMSGPTQDQGPLMPQFDPRGMLGKGASADSVMQMLQLQQAMKKPTVNPIKLGIGEELRHPETFQTLATGPKKEADAPNGVREYQFAVSQGYKGSYEQWDRDQRKSSAARVQVPINVNTAQTFSEQLSKKMADAAEASHGNAKAAVNSIETAHRLKQAVDSGKIVAGPGSSMRVFGLQLGQMLGVGGKNAAETLANTRTAIQSMAQAELDAAQQMKGQGQITEAERDIIRRAASGDINSLTGPEVRQLADSLEKVGRNKIKAHRSNVERLRTIPGTGPLVPMLEMQEPDTYQSPASSAAPGRAPAPGQVQDGYRFKGGNPADPNSWERVL